jgi:hypothetical protein
VKLRAKTPSGVDLLVDVLLSGEATGSQEILGGSVLQVQVLMIACSAVPSVRALNGFFTAWVLPGDLRHDDGREITSDQLLAEIKRVNKQREESMRHPLGDDWP